MNVKVKEVTFEKSVIEVETRSGVKEIIIEKTAYGHSYDDFTEWDITDNQYYQLEDLVDTVMAQMSGSSELNISWD